MSDDLAACAAIVERGDPARFRAVMAAPPAARAKLFPLYAFNVEIARAAYVVSEPGIAEIRLQWWIDALDEIARGDVVRRHEVVVPLALAIRPEQARGLQASVEARFRDIYSDPFADMAALRTYLRATSGTVLETAAALLGQSNPAASRNAGYALGLANWLTAVPALKAAGKHPLPDENPATLAALADEGLAAIKVARQAGIKKSARAAFFVMVGVKPLLKSARKRPERILDGTLEPGPIASSLSLLQAVTLNRW